MKLMRIALALGLATTVAGPLVASASEWWGDDPYWQAQLNRPPSATAPGPRSGGTDLLGRPEQPVGYAAQGTTARDVPGVEEAPERRSGAGIVESTNAERARLEQSGFPQYNQ